MNKDYYGASPTKNEVNETYDFCIVGSGASGIMAALELVQKGFSVLMLEKGPYTNKLQYDDVLMASEPAYARMENGAWSLIGYPWSTCNVGGGTAFYGGISFRYKDIDFDPSHLLKNIGISTKWPYSYSTLSPYYTEVEEMLGVSGNPTADPFCPSDHISYPNPPITYTIQANILNESSKKLGLNPFPTPLAILSQDYKGRKKCNNSSACIENICSNKSKSDSLLFLDKIKNETNFRLFSGIDVIRLCRNRENKVSYAESVGVVNNEKYQFKAKYFILACNAIQSSRVLLNSKDQWSLNGIGNNFDRVGRTFCQKLSGYVTGYLTKYNNRSSINNKGPFSTIAYTDYYVSEEFPFGLGGIIYEAKYGFSYSDQQDGLVIRLECIISDIPDLKNRIKINESDSKIIMDYTPHPLDLVRLQKLMNKAEIILKEAGCKEISFEKSGFGLGSSHLHGTCRYSDNEKEGVLDSNSKVYGVDNLYIIDGSFMPYPASANPTLTIQAHALKTARYLSEIYK